MAFHFLRSGLDVVQRFLSLAIDPDQRERDGRTALFRADSIEAAELLLDAGVDIHARDNEGRTALFGCHENMLDWLLEAGLSINEQDASGRTPAHGPILMQAPTLQALVDRGASLDIPDNNGATPLHTCPQTALLKAPPAGLDWNVRDENGDTPLHYAVRAGTGYWIDSLRELGASDLANNDGHLPMDLTVGQLVVGNRLPAPVSAAWLSAALFDGQLQWEFESIGFGITNEDDAVADPGRFDVVDFRLYSQRLHALSGQRFSHWSELFEQPIDPNAGPEMYALLYRHEHEPVGDSTMLATDFTSTSCQMDWRGQREYFADFHLQTKVELRGIAVHPYTPFGEEANASIEAFAAALRPHLPNLDDNYRIEAVKEHRVRFRAFPK